MLVCLYDTGNVPASLPVAEQMFLSRYRNSIKIKLCEESPEKLVVGKLEKVHGDSPIL